jgi:hypothetical protein
LTKLSKRVVDALRPNPDGKDVFLWDSGDGALKGFGVRMKPSGTGAYIVQYRTAEGRTRRLALGKVGTLTPDEARALARDKLVAVTKGADPSAERHAARASTEDLVEMPILAELQIEDDNIERVKRPIALMEDGDVDHRRCAVRIRLSAGAKRIRTAGPTSEPRPAPSRTDRH